MGHKKIDTMTGWNVTQQSTIVFFLWWKNTWLETIRGGVSQGSILGLHFLLIVVNDIQHIYLFR